MKKLEIFVFVISLVIFIGYQDSDAKGENFYRTYEIIGMTENSLTLRDSYDNVIEVNKDPKDYKVGYNVRYDKIRKRLRGYRWQDYEVTAVYGEKITLRHKSGDTLTVEKNYKDNFKVGDQVRYDTVDNKLQGEK